MNGTLTRNAGFLSTKMELWDLTRSSQNCTCGPQVPFCGTYGPFFGPQVAGQRMAYKTLT